MLLSVTSDAGVFSKGMYQMITVMACTGILENPGDLQLDIFPNPARTFFNVVSRLDAQYELFDALGA